MSLLDLDNNVNKDIYKMLVDDYMNYLDKQYPSYNSIHRKYGGIIGDNIGDKKVELCLYTRVEYILDDNTGKKCYTYVYYWVPKNYNFDNPLLDEDIGCYQFYSMDHVTPENILSIIEN